MKTSLSDPVITGFSATLKELSQPKEMIAEFFSWYHYPDAVRYLRMIFKLLFWVSKRKSLHKKASNILYFYEKIIMLLEISWIMTQHDSTGKSAVIKDTFEDQGPLMNIPMYAIGRQADFAFDYFPRDLTRDELLNPYLVFDRIFKHYSLADWKDKMHSLFHEAMGRYPSNLSSEDFNLYMMPALLGKMIGACHLINIREMSAEKLKFYANKKADTEQAQ